MSLDAAIAAAHQVAAEKVRGCSRPVRLVGSTTTLNGSTGEILDSYSSASEIDGHTYTRCGDRRAWLCESCSHEYKGDAWHLLSTGLTGGKGTPETVAEHPALFLTLTAPSFGLVHGIRKKGPCRGRRDHPVCAHGRPAWCSKRHHPDDAQLGEPLCGACYDYAGHVAWQWWAPELWRRTTITLTRAVADALGVARSKAREHFKLSYSKVTEFQARGVVHFHVVMRLDGPDGPTSPAPSLTTDALAEIVTTAVAGVRVEKPTVEGELVALRWGTQADIRPITSTAGRDASTGNAHPHQVSSYLAKYLTKSCEDFGIRRHIRHLGDTRGLRPHVRAIIETAQAMSRLPGCEAITKRYSTLAYRGHPITKTRRYSTTFGALRSARRCWHQRPAGLDPDATVRELPADDDPEPDPDVITVRSWVFAGIGYMDLPTAHEAIRSATQARKRT